VLGPARWDEIVIHAFGCHLRLFGKSKDCLPGACVCACAREIHGVEIYTRVIG